VHDVYSTGFFAGLPAACFVAGRSFAARGDSAWAAYSVATGSAFLVAMFLTSAGFNQLDSLGELAGLLQRITVATGLTWLDLLSVRLLRNATPVPTAVPRGRDDLAA
jgi:Protein of unknown function (DUF998)